MTIDRISALDFANAIAAGINDRDPAIDTRIDAIRDLFIDPVADVLELQNNRVVYISELQSMKYVDRINPDDLDDVIFNEGMVRWSGSRSVGIVTFARAQPPTSDIVVPINNPLSTDIDSTTGESILFRTTETKTMYASAASSYYNSVSERYELDVAVISVVTGANTQVGAYAIRNMRRPVTGFDEIYNQARTTPGRGLETNAEVATRYLLHVEGSQLGTPAGMKTSILDNFSNVEDAYVVYGEDTNLTREQDDAGAVDIWVLTSAPLERTYTVSYPGIETLITVDRQPVTEVTSVSFGGTTYTEGTDYEVVTGEGEYAYSNHATDGIRFITGGSQPSIGDVITIIYKYNSMINILASYYTQEEYFSMGVDKLFRSAQPKEIEIDANLKVAFGNPTSVLNNVRTAVTDYINDLKLGVSVEEFDLDRQVSAIQGVDNWTYTTLAIKDGSGVADIEVGPNEYPEISSADFNISLVT